MNPPRRHPRRAPREGFILLAVLVFILLLSMISLSMLFRSRADEAAASSTSASEQAWSAIMSGVEEAMRVASTAAPGALDWQDNANLFRERLVCEDGSEQWFFSIYSPALADPLVQIHYGLSDEAGRLNLNHLGNIDLTKVPQLTQDLAQAITQLANSQSTQTTPTPDAISALAVPDVNAAAGSTAAVATDDNNDPDSDAPDPAPDSPIPADTGSSSDGTTPRTSRIREPRGSLATLDDLLRIPGMTWPLLHGKGESASPSANPETESVTDQFPSAAPDQKFDHGLAQYLTVDSYDPNQTDAGARRSNVNNPADSLPAVDIPAAFTNYIAALRFSKKRLVNPADALEANLSYTDDKAVARQITSGVTKENLPQWLDLFSTGPEGRHYGLVNINTASAAVLAALPGMDSSLAEAIVSTRSGISQGQRASIAWLYQQGLVDAARFKSIAPLITARSFQFSFRIIGYSLPSGNYRLYDVAVDVAGGRQRVTYLRDITRLGLPFKLRPSNPSNPDDEASLRSGASPHRNPHG